MSILDEADELRKRRMENGDERVKSIPFEITRFFMALHEVLKTKHQLLGYMREQIYTDVETKYLSISDEEVKKFLKQDQ